MKLTIYDTGMSGFEIEGDMTLTKHDHRTDDFELRLARNTIHMVRPLPCVNNDSWEWLKDYPIQSLELDDLEIYPVWSFDIHGNETDLNKFQTVTITDDEIILSVHAGGTHIEVFNRNLPYIDKQTGKEDNSTWQEREHDVEALLQTYTHNPEDTVSRWADEGLDANDIAKKLFE